MHNAKAYVRSFTKLSFFGPPFLVEVQAAQASNSTDNEWSSASGLDPGPPAQRSADHLDIGFMETSRPTWTTITNQPEPLNHAGPSALSPRHIYSAPIATAHHDRYTTAPSSPFSPECARRRAQFVATMGAALSGIKTLIVPATIAFVVFLVVTFAVLPLWRRYRNRYSQYLPLDSLSSSSLRDRIANRLANLTLPSTWRQDRGRFAATGGGDAGDSDGEELGHVGDGARGFSTTGFGPDTVRLSRDLEEGFIDDSDDEHH